MENIKENNEFKKENLVKNNTEIFKVQLKLSQYEYLTFTIGRFDNIYLKFSEFCITHKIPFYLYKPLLRHIIIAMNQVFELYNLQLNDENQTLINKIRDIYNEMYGKSQEKKFLIKKDN